MSQGGKVSNSGSPGIDRSKFQLVAREAPQVVAGLITLLDQWKAKQVKK